MRAGSWMGPPQRGGSSKGGPQVQGEGRGPSVDCTRQVLSQDEKLVTRRCGLLGIPVCATRGSIHGLDWYKHDKSTRKCICSKLVRSYV